jgi:hypothetical protein
MRPFNRLIVAARIRLAVATSLFALAAIAKGDEATDCNKVPSILTEYGNGQTLNLSQATRYFMEKGKPKLLITDLEAEARKGPITTDKLNKLKADAAKRSAVVLINQYGNGDFATAQDLQNYFMQTDAAFKKDCNPDLFTRIFQDKLHVRNSALEVKGAQLPAQFSWVHTQGSEDAFQTDAAVSYDFAGWKLSPDGHWILYLKPAVEAHTSTLTTATRDSISAKVPMELVYGVGEEQFVDPNYLLKSVLISVAPTFETDHKADTTSYGADVFVAPSVPKLGIGAPWHIGFIYPSWQPYIGFENGYVTKTVGGMRSDTGFDRFVLKLHGQIFITNYFEVAADYTHRTFLGDGPFANSNDISFNYVEASAIFWLDPIDQHFSLGITYKKGEAPPKFTMVDSITAFVGIKF